MMVAAVAVVGGEIDLIIVAAVVDDRMGGGGAGAETRRRFAIIGWCTEQCTKRPVNCQKNVRKYGAPSALRALFLRLRNSQIFIFSKETGLMLVEQKKSNVAKHLA